MLPPEVYPTSTNDWNSIMPNSSESPTTVLATPLAVTVLIDGELLDAAITETRNQTSLVQWIDASGLLRSRWVDNTAITPTARR